MHNPRLFLSRAGFFSKPGLLPWDTGRPPDLSQSLLGRAYKGSFTSVIAKKHPSRQKYQKKQRHCRDDSWQERLADVVTPLWRLSYEAQLKVKFEAQKKLLQSLESHLKVLHGVSDTVAAHQSEGLRCLLHPIIPSVSPCLPRSYLLWPWNELSNIHWALAGVRWLSRIICSFFYLQWPRGVGTVIL